MVLLPFAPAWPPRAGRSNRADGPLAPLDNYNAASNPGRAGSRGIEGPRRPSAHAAPPACRMCRSCAMRGPAGSCGMHWPHGFCRTDGSPRGRGRVESAVSPPRHNDTMKDDGKQTAFPLLPSCLCAVVVSSPWRRPETGLVEGDPPWHPDRSRGVNLSRGPRPQPVGRGMGPGAEPKPIKRAATGPIRRNPP